MNRIICLVLWFWWCIWLCHCWHEPCENLTIFKQKCEWLPIVGQFLGEAKVGMRTVQNRPSALRVAEQHESISNPWKAASPMKTSMNISHRDSIWTRLAYVIKHWIRWIQVMIFGTVRELLLWFVLVALANFVNFPFAKAVNLIFFVDSTIMQCCLKTAGYRFARGFTYSFSLPLHPQEMSDLYNYCTAV